MTDKSWCDEGDKCECGGEYKSTGGATNGGEEIFQCDECGEIAYGPD